MLKIINHHIHIFVMNTLEEYCQWLVTWFSSSQSAKTAIQKWQQALLSSGAPLHSSVIPKRIQYLLPGSEWLVLLRGVLPISLQEEGRASAGERAVPPVSPQLFVSSTSQTKPKGVFAWAGQTPFLFFKHILLLYSFKMLMSCQHPTNNS